MIARIGHERVREEPWVEQCNRDPSETRPRHTRPMILRLVATALLLPFALSACDEARSPSASNTPSPSITAGGTTPASTVNCIDPAARPETAFSSPELREVTPRAANLVVQVTNVAPTSTRMSLEIDEQLALDVGLDAMPTHCYVNPIYEHYYKLRPGQFDITARRDSDPPRTLRINLDDHRRWLVVYGQAGFPLKLKVYRERPLWAA